MTYSFLACQHDIDRSSHLEFVRKPHQADRKAQENFFRMKLILLIFQLASCIKFYIGPGNKKCVRDEVHKDVIVTGEYSYTQTDKFKVRNSYRG